MAAEHWKNMIEDLRKPNIEEPVRQLYDLFFGKIVQQVIVNGGTEEDGADIFQETVLVFIDKVRKNEFRQDSSAATYIAAIARNLWLFEIRTRERRRKRESAYFVPESVEVHLEAPSFSKKNKVDLVTVLDQLGEICKRLLKGFYFEEKSMKELLTSFDYQNEQVLRNRKSKCMRKLKELLQDNKELLESLNPSSSYE